MSQEKLSKALDEIDALADEILAKSEETEELEKSEDSADLAGEESDVKKGLKPDEVAKDEDDKDDDDEDDEDEDDDKDKDEKEVQKSFGDLAEESDAISKAVEVSDFLAEMTRVQGAILDSVRSDVNKSLETSTQTATILAKSFNAIMKSQSNLSKSLVSISKSLGALESRIEQVERAPQPRKAVVNVMEKSFNHSAGVSEGKTLSKSEISSKLSDLFLSGKEGVTAQDIIAYESNGTMRPEVQSIIEA